MKKVCLLSSSGGHYEQLLMLRKLEDNYNTFMITEKTKYNKDNEKIKYFFPQINRKELLFIPKMILIFIKALYIFIKEKPDVIISTGALVAIPMLVIGHTFRKKVIFLESFAKISSPTMTGNFVYKHHLADQFYVQWESMKEFYPNAICKGGIY